MSDVQEKLASCGFGPFTAGGYRVLAFERDGGVEFVGLVQGQPGYRVEAVRWSPNGKQEKLGSPWSLVRLPSHESPPIEFVRHKDNPDTLYRPVSIMRDVDGTVYRVDCGAVVLSWTNGLQAKINGQWREI